MAAVKIRRMKWKTTMMRRTKCRGLSGQEIRQGMAQQFDRFFKIAKHLQYRLYMTITNRELQKLFFVIVSSLTNNIIVLVAAS
jgi:hypothetical protein